MTHEELVDLVAKQIVLMATDGYNSREMAAAIVPLVVEACAEEACAGTEPCGKRIAKRIRKLGGTP